MIYKICSTYCPDNEDRKDLQQEILLQLWNSFGKFDGRVKISTWIYRIALNTAISFYRSEKKHSHNKVTIEESLFLLPDPGEADSQTDDNIQRLYLIISKLNELEKALILLYLDDLRYNEIANIIGITETNVATKLNRIKQRIRKQFEQ